MGTMLDYAGVGWDPIRDSDGNFATGIMSALQLSKGTYGDPTSEWYMPAGLFSGGTWLRLLHAAEPGTPCRQQSLAFSRNWTKAPSPSHETPFSG